MPELAPPPLDEAALLVRLSELVSARTGLMLAQAQWIDLRRAVVAVATELAFTDWHTCLKLLVSPSGGPHLQALIDQLTVGETYFFRDSALFSILRERILPDLIQQRRPSGQFLRLWSAACCSGEEPYSIAIELARALPDLQAWNVTLLATDINRRFLRKAERGVYERWSFRDRPIAACAPYILPVAGNRFAVAPVIRGMVQFAFLNLAEDCYPAGTNSAHSMDIILCRNALMYLQPECIKDVVARLSRCLVEGGWLITSTIEASLVDRPELVAVRLPDLVLFRKQSLQLPAREPAAPIEPERLAATSNEDAVLPLQRETAVANTAAATMPAAEPGAARALLIAARSHADRGMLAAARADCERALAIDRLDADANFLHANILLELGVVAEAEQALRRTLYLDPRRAIAHVALATLLSQQPQRREEAARCWHSARTLLGDLLPETIVPDSDGLTGRQLLDMVAAMSMPG